MLDTTTPETGTWLNNLINTLSLMLDTTTPETGTWLNNLIITL
jgi:hypothetical protein